MIKGNGTSKPYLHMIGNSSTDVTGSMHHLRFKKYSLLLDAGMIQGGDLVANYLANKDQLKKIKPREIDYIILSHIHIDHSGLIPALFAKGCNAHVYVPQGTIPFLKLLWEDSLKIHVSDCQKIEAKHGRKASPLYTDSDIEKALFRCIEVGPEEYRINEDIAFQYLSAGHIIHSTQIYLELRQGNIIKRVGYTGDIGGVQERWYVRDRDTMPYVDVLIGENTYNSKSRPNNAKDRINDIRKIKSIINESNKILIPCFSLQRTQELITVLGENELINPSCSVYLDSPLASKFCDMWADSVGEDGEEFEKYMSKVKVLNDYEQSKRLQESDEHCIIISASGFLQGGRIMNHLKTALSNPNNHILFIGYAGENNLASQIKSGQKEVKVDGELVQNNANITELRSFSSHANYEELMKYYSEECRYSKIALVHGNFSDKVDFAHELQENLIQQGKSSRVIATNQDQKIYI